MTTEESRLVGFRKIRHCKYPRLQSVAFIWKNLYERGKHSYRIQTRFNIDLLFLRIRTCSPVCMHRHPATLVSLSSQIGLAVEIVYMLAELTTYLACCSVYLLYHTVVILCRSVLLRHSARWICLSLERECT